MVANFTYLGILVTTSQFSKKLLVLNRIISVRYQQLKPLNSVDTIVITVCKQISFKLFKNKRKISYKLFTYNSYIYNLLNVCKEMINHKKKVFVSD